MRNESGDPTWLVPVIVALLLVGVAVGLGSMLSSGLAAQRIALQTIAISTAPPPPPAATLASTLPPSRITAPTAVPPTARPATPVPTFIPTAAPTPAPSGAMIRYTGFGVVNSYLIATDGVLFSLTLLSARPNTVTFSSGSTGSLNGDTLAFASLWYSRTRMPTQSKFLLQSAWTGAIVQVTLGPDPTATDSMNATQADSHSYFAEFFCFTTVFPNGPTRPLALSC